MARKLQLSILRDPQEAHEHANHRSRPRIIHARRLRQRGAFEKVGSEVTGRVSERSPVLVVTVGALACAIPLRHVVETMRPLPIEPVAGTPRFVRGVSLIRGTPTPVVDLKALLENVEPSATYGRFVTLKLGERRGAIGVDDVIGIRDLEGARLGELPPMLRDVATDLVEAIGARDAQLLVVLRAARVLPEEVWTTLAAGSKP